MDDVNRKANALGTLADEALAAHFAKELAKPGMGPPVQVECRCGATNVIAMRKGTTHARVKCHRCGEVGDYEAAQIAPRAVGNRRARRAEEAGNRKKAKPRHR